MAAPPATPRPRSDVTLGAGPRKLLLILAHHRDGLPKNRLAALAGYSPRKSTIRNHLSELRVAGFVLPGEPICPTPEGLAHVADDVQELPSGDELLEHWFREVGGGATQALLRVLIDAWPRNLTKEEAAAAAGIDPNTSTVRNAISRLRTLGLAQRDGFRADDAFMEAIGG